MNCKNEKDLITGCNYSIGGIHSIWILDINDFDGYVFNNDSLYDSMYVDNIYVKGNWYELQAVDEANFTEKVNNGAYQQQLTTFIGLYDADIQREMLKSTNSKFLVVFRTFTRKYFVFGSDGGVTLTYENQSGAKTESIGYSVTLSINSSYPLFELNPNYFNSEHTVNFIYKPIYDSYTCELSNGYNNGYQVANYAVRITTEGEAVDKNGKLCSDSGFKQAAMKLQGTSLPSRYDDVGTYTSDSILKGGITVKQINYLACRPQFQGTIKLDKNTIIANINDRIHSVKVTSENEWEITNYNSYYVISNYTSAGPGIFNTTITANRYGNRTLIYRNNYTLEEVELTVMYCVIVIPNDNLELNPEGDTRTISIMAQGGNEDYTISSNIPSWLTVSKLSNSQIRIVATENDTKLYRNATITLRHITDTRVTATISISQEPNFIITIPDFNYLTFRYYWTEADGRDLDTATVLINTGLVETNVSGETVTIDDKPVGWNMSGNTIAEVQKYLKFGGDNTGNGNEAVFIDWLAICSEENLPILPDVIHCDIYCNWFGEKRNGNMSFEINAYKGGEMVKDPENNFNYINSGGTLQFSSIETKYINAACSSNREDYKSKYTYTARVSYDKITQDARLTIIQGSSGNDCSTNP